MDGGTRRTRFETRVDLEREFLTCINQKFGETAPLAGMTGDAIESWAARAKERTRWSLIPEVRALLLEISVRADLLADNSRDVFDRDGALQPKSLDDLRALLRATLSSMETRAI